MSRDSSGICHGIVLVDKPSGLTSNRVLQKVRAHYQKVKAGHAGTLDPLATGVLPILLGDATRFSAFLLDCDKTYAVTARLGQRTDSGDSEGTEITASSYMPTQEELQTVIMNHFIGEIEQSPSVYSAIKIQGMPAYHWKRKKGLDPEMPIRRVQIHRIAMEDYMYPYFSLVVSCSKGTYIRSLIDDIGIMIGSYAHVTALRRIAVGSFFVSDAVSLETLADSQDCMRYVRSPECLFSECPVHVLGEDDVERILRGASVVFPHPSARVVRLRLYYRGNFIGIGTGEDGSLAQLTILRALLLTYRSADQEMI